MTGTRVVYAVLDTQHLILYAEDGSTFTIPQGDGRLRPILDQVTPILRAGGVATVVIDGARNDYADFQKKTNGLVKFFRVAKKAVAHLLGSSDIETFGTPPTGGAAAAESKVATAIEDIMAHATPVSDKGFSENQTTGTDTMIAVVGDGENARIIPGVEALKDQVAHANKLGSTKGVENLLKRLGQVIDKRGHAVDDVMRFIDKGDLPIADDGSIIAYKILRKTPKNGASYTAKAGRFFDCHSGKVPQEIGSYVCMDEKLVDLNRRTECSVGLHIARRGYLTYFSGDVCTIVKIAPEDVITVPHNEPDKVRVRGYHILGVLPDEDWSNLRRGKPLTSEIGQQLLGQVVAGQHIGKLERVEISGPMGNNVTVTSLVDTPTTQPTSSPAPKAVALDDESIAPEKVKDAKPVNPKDVAQKSQEQKAPMPLTQAEVADKALGPMSPRMKKATDLVRKMRDLKPSDPARHQAALDLQAHKKKSKVSYTTLGLTALHIKNLEGVLAAGATTPIQVAKVSPTPKKTPAVKAKPEQLVASKKTAKPETKVPAKGSNRQQVAKQLHTLMTNKKLSDDSRTMAAIDLQDHKKKSKVSWTTLGLPEDTGKAIDKHLKNTN